MKIHIIKREDPRPAPEKLLLLELLPPLDPPLERLVSFDAIGAANNGFHIISVAALSLTHFSAMCEFGFGIPTNQQEMLIQPILRAKETGTLFPKHRLTILPYRYHTTPIMLSPPHDYTHGKGFTIEEVETHIRDAIRAERDHIKAGQLLFDVRDYGDDMLRYRNTIERLLRTECGQYDWSCYMYSFDNSEFTNNGKSA